MKLGIMQPYFLPYIGYFQLIKAVDKYVIYDDVNYIKKGWINRNNILCNGQAHLFSISLRGASQNKLINEIEISDDFSKFRKMIELSYRKAPYFEEVFKLLNSIIDYPNKNLSLFLANSIKEICKYLSIDTEIIFSSEIEKNNDLKGQEKILEICKILQAKTYTNAIGGQSLYDKDIFLKENIELYFLQSNLTVYKQNLDEFIPYLSILDVMMWNSKDEINSMLESYELI